MTDKEIQLQIRKETMRTKLEILKKRYEYLQKMEENHKHNQTGEVMSTCTDYLKAGTGLATVAGPLFTAFSKYK